MFGRDVGMAQIAVLNRGPEMSDALFHMGVRLLALRCLSMLQSRLGVLDVPFGRVRPPFRRV